MNRNVVKRVAQLLVLAGLMIVATKTTKARECPECACAVYCVEALVLCTLAHGNFNGCGWTGSECQNLGCDIIP